MNILHKQCVHRRKVYVMLLMLLFTTFSYAQQSSVVGKVLDSSNVPIIGATVQEKGSDTGTITDFDGNFNLMVKNPQTSVIVISYIGYKQQELMLKGRKNVKIVLSESVNELEEVTVVAYGVQKKETLTGAISSVGTDALLLSPNASVANSLAGKISGLSTVQNSGQPGAEDPQIFVRGVGTLTEDGGAPLILVDGVERDFFQMDPNEIESVTVLKDASATAVFGVRGANGVILVTTRRGEEGTAKIQVNSSVGFQMPTRMLESVDSYTYALMHNERSRNDNTKEIFDVHTRERFRLGDEPVMYPSIKWREYMLKNASLQTQHNLNISGGTKTVRYFISLGYLYQDGLLKDFGEKNAAYKYNRYNYRANLDMDITSNTTLKIGIGGLVGDRYEPRDNMIWKRINIAQPFSSPGIIDDRYLVTRKKFGDINNTDPLQYYYKSGTKRQISNTMNLDLHLVQKLDMITKGLSVEVKGAYNTDYSYIKTRSSSTEVFTPFYQSELENSQLPYDDPSFNKTIVYQVSGQNTKPTFSEGTSRARNWYLEASLRYNRKFGNHNVGALLLYNQSKKYYPSEYVHIPTAYVGLVGRITYDYKSRYMAEFNIGYNGSENFAPDKRFGTFPAVSLGYILSEEGFMKNQNVFSYLKFRASVGLVGNDNMNGHRFLYLPDAYNVNMEEWDSGQRSDKWGYNFGLNNSTLLKGAMESRLANPNVTWETALKQNYGVDMHFLNSRLKLSMNYFRENRKDILISRSTVPVLLGLTTGTNGILPVLNMGKVENNGYEIELNWNDKIGDSFDYYINPNVSYSKNKIIFQDEVEPNEPYQWRTGQQVGAVFGYVADGFYSKDDFVDPNLGILKEGLPVPNTSVRPGDVIYRDLNKDGVIDNDDQKKIGFSQRPNYVFGLNMGASYKGLFFTMNWVGAAERSIVLSSMFSQPFQGQNNGLFSYLIEDRWTEETASTAKLPRLSAKSQTHNSMTSTLWVKNGSYFKLKNLTIGYNFIGNPFLKKLGIRQFGVKFTGYNLLTFDSFNIMDPECDPGFESDKYPVVKIFDMGVNLTF